MPTFNGKTNWVLRETVMPADLNRIEQGIIDAFTAINGISIPDATLSEKGIVMLSNTITGQSETKAATEKAVSDARVAAINFAKDHGLGTLSVRLQGVDLNNLPEKNGFYYIMGSSTNRPGGSNGYLIHQQYSTGYAVQMFYTLTGDLYTRGNNGGTWAEWKQQETTTGSAAKASAAQTAAINFAKSFGLGSVAKSISGTNLNALDDTGFYAGSNMTNKPPMSNLNPDTASGGWYFIINLKTDNNYRTQIAIEFGSAYMYRRTSNAGTWTPWIRVVDETMKNVANGYVGLDSSGRPPQNLVQPYFNGVAGEAITKGDVLNIGTDGRVRKSRNTFEGTVSLVKQQYLNAFEAATNYTNTTTMSEDGKTALMTLSDGNTRLWLGGVVFNVNGETIYKSIELPTVAGSLYHAIHIGDNVYAVFYRSGSNNIDVITVVVNLLTADVAIRSRVSYVQSVIPGGNAAWDYAIYHLGNNNFALQFIGSDNKWRVMLITENISAGTFTNKTPSVFNVTKGYGARGIGIDSTRFIHAYSGSGGYYVVIGQVDLVTGVVTNGTPLLLFASGGYGNFMAKFRKITDNRLMTVSGAWGVTELNISGTSIVSTISMATIISNWSNQNRFVDFLYLKNQNKFIILTVQSFGSTNSGDVSVFYTFWVFDVNSSGDINYASVKRYYADTGNFYDRTITNGSSGVYNTDFINITDGGGVYIPFTQGYDRYLSVYETTPDKENIGIALSNASLGATIPIQYTGLVQGLTGLIPGTPYSYNNNGALSPTLDRSPKMVGTAISTTELLLN